MVGATGQMHVLLYFAITWACSNGGSARISHNFFSKVFMLFHRS
jgi:hypothetical protein